MSLPPEISVWDLWAESAKNRESLGDPLFLECLEAAANVKLFDDLTDDKLKISLSIINSLLNDPKTRQKGLTLFSDLSSQINPARLIGFQDAVISSLHLIVKGLDSPLASLALANFLPKCHCMTEVNQVVTSSIIPKILSYFVEESQASVTQKSSEEIALLKVCLLEYHGPCGHFRDKLESIFVPVIDSENKELVHGISEVMPLVSYAGGGGSVGEKHIKDWNKMLTKFLKATYSTLFQMYGDISPTLDPENPFDAEQLTGIKRILESQVLLRFSLLKRRLQNLLTIVASYLRYPFPAPKLVPLKGILKLIECLTSVVPLCKTRNSSSQSQTKENVFITSIAPGIHVTALNLLGSLFNCVGSNIFPEALTVEQIINSEFKWLQENPKAFEGLKLALYDAVIVWLNLTGGNLTSLKTVSFWTNAIGIDTRVEKDIIELKMLSKPKPGKSVKLMSNSSMTLSSGSTTQVFITKSSNVCHIALKTLTYLIPTLDPDNHKKIYEHLIKTVSIICHFQCPPSPYDNAECRKLVYQNLTVLTVNPKPQSPVSLSLIVSLLRRGMQDPVFLVSEFCALQISQVERLFHPISAPLILAGPAPPPIILDISKAIVNENPEMEEEEEVNDYETEANETLVNNESMIVEEPITNHQVPTSEDKLSPDRLIEVLGQKMEQQMKKIFGEFTASFTNTVNKSQLQKNKSAFADSTNRNSSVNDVTVAAVPATTPDVEKVYDVMSASNSEDDSDVVVVNSNGYHLDEDFENNAVSVSSEDALKRKADDDHNVEPDLSKKSKITSPEIEKQTSETSAEQIEEGSSVEEMLSTFVDIEPTA